MVAEEIVADEVMEAVRAFVNAADWAAMRQVVEAEQNMLFRSEVEALFEEDIVRAAGDECEFLAQHLQILRDCKRDGIAPTFDRLIANAPPELPFDADLIPRRVAALLGTPQEKLKHVQFLATLAAGSRDEELKHLITALQTALFGASLASLGGDLSGPYRQAWEEIVLGVESDGLDPQVFAAIVSNTRAVLGPAASQRDQWRAQIVTLQHDAQQAGRSGPAHLATAIIGLLDADGNPAGLGENLAGIYARTWRAILVGPIQHEGENAP